MKMVRNMLAVAVVAMGLLLATPLAASASFSINYMDSTGKLQGNIAWTTSSGVLLVADRADGRPARVESEAYVNGRWYNYHTNYLPDGNQLKTAQFMPSGKVRFRVCITNNLYQPTYCDMWFYDSKS